MYLRIFTLLIFMAFFVQTKAQTIAEKIFYQWGGQIGATVLPSYDRIYTDDPYSNSDETELRGNQSYTFEFGMLCRLRYNLLEIDNNKSIGLGIAPGLSYMLQATSLPEDDIVNSVGFSLPFEFSYNFGPGSTYDSDKNVGFVFVAGAAFLLPGITFQDVSNNRYNPIKKAYTIPHIGGGITWGDFDSRIAELFLRVEIGNNKHTASFPDDSISVKSPVGFKLILMKYFNY